MRTAYFYKFIHENNIEFHWRENPETGESDVIFFINRYQIDNFIKILTIFDFDGEGIKCIMKDGCLVVWASEILDSQWSELTDVFGECTL